MADDGITTIEEFAKILISARENCLRILRQDIPPKDENGNPYSVYCRGEWDELTCWPNSPPNQQIKVHCPEYVEDFDHSEEVHRYCKKDGTWYWDDVSNHTWSDYARCYEGTLSAKNLADLMRSGGESGHWATVQNTNRTWSHYRDCPKTGIEDVEDVTRLIKEGNPQMRSLTQLYTVGYSFSLVALIFAFVILAHFKRLHCTRNYIHMHLFASFILRAIFIFIKDRVLFYGAGILDIQTQDGKMTWDVVKESVDEAAESANSYLTGCKIVMTLFHYFLATNYYWILVEALYLHSLIFVAFFSDKKYLWRFTMIGWGVPVLFVVPWAIVRATTDASRQHTSCWDIAIPEYKWIYNGPIVVANVINFLLFLNIVRVLWYKMKERGLVGGQGKTDNRRQYKKLAKSTLVLIPMFGVHAIIFIGMPDGVTSGTWWTIRMYFDLFFNSFQGFFVAIIYCFCNGEVQAEFKKAWERFNLSAEIQKGRRERSRSSVTMITTFNSSGSHQGRLSLSGISNGRGSSYRSNGSVLSKGTTPVCADQRERETSFIANEVESKYTEVAEDDRSLSENGKIQELAPLVTSRRCPPPFIRMQSGGFGARSAADAILPIAEEVDVEEQAFESAVEGYDSNQDTCLVQDSDLNLKQNAAVERCDEADEKYRDIVEVDESSSPAWQKHLSGVKRAESEDSGISSNFCSSMRRGSAGAKVNGNRSNSDLCCDGAASSSDLERAEGVRQLPTVTQQHHEKRQNC